MGEVRQNLPAVPGDDDVPNNSLVNPDYLGPLPSAPCAVDAGRRESWDMSSQVHPRLCLFSLPAGRGVTWGTANNLFPLSGSTVLI